MPHITVSSLASSTESPSHITVQITCPILKSPNLSRASFITYWLCTLNRIPSFYGKPKVHYRVYKCPPSVSILIQINPVHAPSHFLRIHFAHLRPGLPSGLFPSRLATKTLYAPLLSPIRVTCPVHPILNNLFHKTKWIPFNMISSAPLASFLKHFYYEGQC